MKIAKLKVSCEQKGKKNRGTKKLSLFYCILLFSPVWKKRKNFPALFLFLFLKNQYYLCDTCMLRFIAFTDDFPVKMQITHITCGQCLKKKKFQSKLALPLPLIFSNSKKLSRIFREKRPNKKLQKKLIKFRHFSLCTVGFCEPNATENFEIKKIIFFS